ncbi:hypothetical protein SAMN06265338_1404 [Rhodoblastus acidophilus]|uniref:Uncharacterized protein n=1 Tax=Rhodoblastus acidophilus TaxID=1074 RepID=A0A212SGJ6_RHOAC|nr:hypothetical protein [Rhodoblastus acidophilus]PPQ34748.1 hypothetical protein CKO16_21995 [Rhodoblastus acidophilus]RAI16551.1 hypothetical protein CH337_20850 [Rhodoblastus acidophilus]SNB84829.1 hypothetical protein SAMN06265338_1404 [Rhodoblastus acidophilus]
MNNEELIANIRAFVAAELEQREVIDIADGAAPEYVESARTVLAQIDILSGRCTGPASEPGAEAEQFIQAAIDRAPEPLRRLGAWLANKLDDDDWKTADRLITGAAWSLDQTSPAVRDVLSERQRQISVEGWTPEHDDGHKLGELGLAGALYALPYDSGLITQDDHIALDIALDVGCGWDVKPEPDKRLRLVKAGALILAEIERLDRAAKRAA